MGDGFTNMIVPTNAVLMGVVALAGIPWPQWARWVLPLQMLLFLVGLLALRVGLDRIRRVSAVRLTRDSWARPRWTEGSCPIPCAPGRTAAARAGWSGSRRGSAPARWCGDPPARRRASWPSPCPPPSGWRRTACGSRSVPHRTPDRPTAPAAHPVGRTPRAPASTPRSAAGARTRRRSRTPRRTGAGRWWRPRGRSGRALG
ncbi:MAG: hypothetical protein HY657_09425 [Acidobacteria bacterium]|nr:hypothetical protein [Acidobacteriota bacterium]